MANNASSSSSLRFLRLPQQPGSESINQAQNHDPFDLHESDVWSFAVSGDAHLHPSSTPPQLENNHHIRRGFNPAELGLSAALSDDHHRLIRRKAKAVPAVTRHEDAPSPAAFHQSAPVRIPVWPGKSRRDYGNGDSFGESDGDEDAGEEEQEMVPPHVIVARSHVTFSVFEGVGRTLKGRDLRRVRNTVFQKTGFLD